MKYQSRESSIESGEDQSMKVNRIPIKRDTSGQSTVVTNVGPVHQTYDEKVIKRA